MDQQDTAARESDFPQNVEQATKLAKQALRDRDESPNVSFEAGEESSIALLSLADGASNGLKDAISILLARNFMNAAQLNWSNEKLENAHWRAFDNFAKSDLEIAFKFAEQTLGGTIHNACEAIEKRSLDAAEHDSRVGVRLAAMHLLAARGWEKRWFWPIFKAAQDEVMRIVSPWFTSECESERVAAIACWKTFVAAANAPLLDWQFQAVIDSASNASHTILEVHAAIDALCYVVPIWAYYNNTEHDSDTTREYNERIANLCHRTLDAVESVTKNHSPAELRFMSGTLGDTLRDIANISCDITSSSTFPTKSDVQKRIARLILQSYDVYCKKTDENRFLSDENFEELFHGIVNSGVVDEILPEHRTKGMFDQIPEKSGSISLTRSWAFIVD